MSDYSIDLNGVRCVSARLVTCFRGAWFVDLTLDPDSEPVTSADVPTGKVAVTIAAPGSTPVVLVGAVDPDASGRFVSTVPVRVWGGKGWSKAGNVQAWHSDAGVSSVTVESSVAAIVGETVNDPAPALVGIDWSLTADQPASSVFGDRSWYVDVAGVTQVGARPAVPPDASVQLLEWDPLKQHGMLAADALVLPGTVLVDARFDGPITLRDVVQTWDHTGTRVEVWCGSSAFGRLQSVLTNLVRGLAGIAHLKRYRYRIVTQNSDGRLVLQPVANPDGSPSKAPNVSPLSVAPGMSGLSALYKLSSECTVAFCNGDPAQAFVESFDNAIPTALTLDATGSVAVGPSASSVAILDGSTPMAKLGDLVQTVVSGVLTVLAGTLTVTIAAPFVPGTPNPVVVTTGALTVQGVTPSSGTIVSGSAKLKGPAT